jgi:hypothetical protein
VFERKKSPLIIKKKKISPLHKFYAQKDGSKEKKRPKPQINTIINSPTKTKP